MSNYPRLNQLNIPVHTTKDVSYVYEASIKRVLKDKWDDFLVRFGVQASPMVGAPAMYPWDVERVLERMSR